MTNCSVVATDFLGNRIFPGCEIVYPTRRGSEMWLNKTRVTGVDVSGPKPVLLAFNGRRPIRIQNTCNCVVVMAPDVAAEEAKSADSGRVTFHQLRKHQRRTGEKL